MLSLARDRSRMQRPKCATLFVWDFTQQSAGALVLPAGLTFARASSGHTVQDGADALITSGITSNDVGRIGRLLAAQSYGLFMEPARTNLITNSRNLTAAGWAAGSGATTTAAYAAGPDGASNASRTQITSGGFSKYFATGGPNARCFSAWGKALSGLWVPALEITVQANSLWSSSAATTWARADFYSTTTAYAVPCDARSVYTGTTAAARDVLTDFHQLEAAKYPSSAIVTSGGTATRAGERAAIDSAHAAASVVNGRLGVYLKLRALAASTELAATEGTLLAWLTGSVYVDPTSLFLKAIDGSTYSQTANAVISWSRYDLLEFAIEVGAGKSAIRWRVNGGTTNAAVFSTRDDTIGALNLSAGLDFCNTAAAGQMPSIIERLSTFIPGRAPF